jgi:phage gp45-like
MAATGMLSRNKIGFCFSKAVSMQHAKSVGALIVLLFLYHIGFSQQLRLGNNPYTVEKSAVLELQSTNQGLLFPRIADTLLINVLNPPDGMVIYFTQTKQLLLRANGAWRSMTNGTAISSLNGLTATTQTFATGTAGNDFNIASAGSVHTFNIPDASATARGLLTTGAQTVAGTKTFTSVPIFSSLTPGSVPFIGSGGVLAQNNSSLFWDATNAHLGVGTNAPGSDLTLFQRGSGTSAGFRFTGNAATGANTGSGFSMVLGYNVPGNKQLWLGDADYLGNGAGTFVRYSSSGGTTILDAISGDNGVRRPTMIGVGSDANSAIILGSDGSTTVPSSYVWTNGNMAIGNSYRSNAAPANGLLVQGSVGIGTTTPATKLHVTGTNPLTLTGVQLGSSTTADSLLTITNGLVRKLPISTFATPITTGNLTETGSSILTITGGTGAVVGTGATLQVKQANASQSGFLSSTDWTTFNNKLSTVDTTNIASFSTKVRSLFGAGTGITYNAATGIISATASSNNWLLSGNAGITPASQFIGTTDAQPFITRTSNTERMRVDAAGRVGIGVTTVNNLLEVGGTVAGTGISGLRLTGLGTATAGAANSKVLSVNSNGDVIVTANAALNNWLITGNAGTDPSVNFLGTTDDKQLVLKSNNSPYVEFGRRQTLGLTQPYTDYDNNDEQVLHMKSAVQFYAPAAQFYKPKIYVDANGNFRTKGSSAGTDYFEFGATGSNNNGGFEFIIGDDGDEPILFKSYNYLTGMSEIMRLQSGRMAVGSNSFNSNNPEKLLIDAGNTDSYNLMTGKGSIDNYLQINVQNRSSGNNASSDLVATADNGDEGSNYIDMGINSSTFSNTSYPIIGGINNAYLYSTGQDFVIGNGTVSKNLRFFTGGFNAINERMRIDGIGNISIGNTAPTEKLDITGNLKFSGALMPNNNAGTAGFLLQSNGTNTAPSWINASTLLTGAAWALDGNSVAAIRRLGTITNYDLPFITNNIERARITTSGYFGLGTNAPAGRLHLANDNSELGNDYIFDDYGAGTSQGFFIRKARGTQASPTNVVNGDILGMMRFSGRTNGAFNFTAGSGIDAYYKGSGTNDLTDMRLFTSNAERMRIDESGNVAIGATDFDVNNPEQLLIDAGTTTSVNALYAKGSINSYFQINIKNNSAGSQSSSDLVATANNGTETTNFVNLGINGSNFSYQAGNPIETGKSNDGYMISAGNDFYLVNNNTLKDMIFLTGGTASTNEAMRITSTRRLGIGSTAPSTSLHIKTGTANDGGLRMENLTSASAVTAGAGVLGVDATGKVVRAKTPLYYSGTGTANTEEVTKIWVADFANNGTGTPSVTIPANIGFANILSIQVTAKGGSNVANAPIATITSNTLTNVTVRVVESNVTVVAGEGLTAHTDTNTRIYIRVEGN